METPFVSVSVKMTISRNNNYVFSLVTDEDIPPKVLQKKLIKEYSRLTSLISKKSIG